jgi:hypothetical protein
MSPRWVFFLLVFLGVKASAPPERSAVTMIDTDARFLFDKFDTKVANFGILSESLKGGCPGVKRRNPCDDT